MRRGYDGVEGSIGRSYDEIKDVTMTVSGNFNMLIEITTGKKLKTSPASFQHAVITFVHSVTFAHSSTASIYSQMVSISPPPSTSHRYSVGWR